MAAVSTALGLPPSGLQLDAESLSTIPDPRSPDEFPSPQRSASSSPHPNLNSEVATLSNKLISAINHQTNLDDTLTATRQELEATRDRLRELEVENKEHTDLIAAGALIRKAEADEQASRLVAKLAEERKRRTVVEKDKRGIEQELENLTTALFEEANQMVAAARKERESAERRNDQLRTQLNDTELLLASHQEQLAELKAVMQQMNSNREDPEAATNRSTAPSTPALTQHSDLSRVFDTLHLSPSVPGDDVPPAPPTSFSHLLSPVLRMDLHMYEDFRSLVQVSKKSAPPSRATSGSYAGVNVLGLSNMTSRDANPQPNCQPSNGSTTSLSSAKYSFQTPTSTPNTPATSASSLASPVMPLKETRFYKRALAEDIEPTLRLDTAPGLSWLARRTVINSMCEGTLVVEPMPALTKMSIFSCALCGENRRGDEFTRTHRFRTSESENAQRYPLCNYCLNRVRASCDYLGFLRMIKDGHWRTDGPEAEKMAWEESVRLRERMFWARIGGGVVPAYVHRDAPRVSMDGTKPKTPLSAPATMGAAPEVQLPTSSTENEDPFNPCLKRASIGKMVFSQRHSEMEGDSEEDWETAKKAAIVDDTAPSPKKEPDAASRQLHTSLRDSLRPKPRSRAASYEKEQAITSASRKATSQQSLTPLQRSETSQITSELGLSITIPGAFEY